MSKLRNRLADLKDDLTPEKFEAAINQYGQIHTMTLFLLNQDLPYFSQVESMMGLPLPQAKEQFIQLFKEVNNKYANDDSVSTWSDTKIREFEMKVKQCKNFYGIINYIHQSGLKQASLNGRGIIQVAKTLLKIEKMTNTKF